MIKRIYLFILIGTVIQNSYLILYWLGVPDDWVYFNYFPACQRLEITLLPLWWCVNRLFPVENKENDTWIYMIAATYFIFQMLDVYDTIANDNQRDSGIDFILFISLNVLYWLIYRKK